ncbi:succinylglutamate desuccinylase/aspartoacylase family protein [Novosphingobium lentum]|uniref:succinylglutamate desuccinylase/aspartoacylase family protein n=1 Tax=Novosphingobium lentum TaxID=145287 RepID=UPI000A072C60|nr:succinylglutamate desuccinylase/aspartoacylase family protein [Novosphingobium lentum]
MRSTDEAGAQPAAPSIPSPQNQAPALPSTATGDAGTSGHPAFVFGKHRITPASEGVLDLPVASLSTGTPVSIPLRVLHGSRPGPTMFVSAAIHGDEIIGAEIIRRLRRRLNRRAIAGTVLLVPVVNVFGFLNHERTMPDRRDLNRSFPGSGRGSLATQVANTFYRKIIKRCSFGIDIHSAAAHRYNLPQIRVAAGDPHLLELAMAFGAPAVVEASLRPGSMRAIAQQQGVDMLLLEAGEALRFDEFSIRVGLAGIMRVMAKLGMIEDADIPGTAAVPAHTTRSLWLRAPVGGIARLTRLSGALIRKGDRLGTVGDILGEHAHALLSPIDGIVIGHTNLPVVNQGDALLHIAEVLQIDSAEQRMDSITGALLSSDLLDEDEVV